MEEIEKYAKENRIPIMQKDGILYLVNYIKENKITNILEIGEVGAQVKHLSKTTMGSSYAIDRRD